MKLPPRRRPLRIRIARWLLTLALLPAAALLIEHVRGQILLRRVLARHGIPFPKPSERWDTKTADAIRVTPRFREALRLAADIEPEVIHPPPALVLLRPAHALPLSEFDWWSDSQEKQTNSWEVFLARWDPVAGTLTRINTVLAGQEKGPSTAVTSEITYQVLMKAGRLERIHGMVGLRRGRPEAVLEALGALQTMAGDVSGPFTFGARGWLQREQARLRLAAVVAGGWDDEYLRELMPPKAPFEMPEDWEPDDQKVLAIWVAELRNGRLDELFMNTPPDSVFTELTRFAKATANPGFELDLLLDLLDEIADTVKGQVLLPICRFGWGDLAIAQGVEEGQRDRERARQVIAARSWKVAIKDGRRERGWYGEWIAGFNPFGPFDRSTQQARGVCRQQTETGLSAAGIALERYRLKHGRYPEELSHLVPEFLTEIPTDWFCGEPLRYRREADGTFRLWGVGENGVDDGGKDFDTSGPRQAVLTKGRFASQDLWHKDVLWPTRGTEEQRVKAIEEHVEHLQSMAEVNSWMSPELMRRFGLQRGKP